MKEQGLRWLVSKGREYELCEMVLSGSAKKSALVRHIMEPVGEGVQRSLL